MPANFATVKSFALALLTLLLSSIAHAATLYVATTGSNTTGNGSQGSPWATIQFAVNNAAFTPGSEIIVADGDYAPFFVNKSGSTAALRYTVRASGSNARVLGSVVNDGRPAAIHVTVSYVTIDGFVVDVQKTSGDSFGIRSRGIRVSGESFAHIFDVRILNNKVSNAGWVGISTSYAENVLIEGNDISNSKGQHGLYVANSADGPIIRRNVARNNAWAGIQINADPEAAGDGIISNAVVEQNISHSNGIGGTDGAGGASFDFASIRNARIINNLSYDNQRQGIVLWDDGFSDAFGSMNNLVANNTVVMPTGSSYHAFSIRNGSTGNTVRNNVLIHQGSYNDSIAIDPESLSGFTSNFNIVSAFENTAGNLVSLATWRTQTGQDLNSFVATTSIFTNFAARDFTLAAGSAAINAGTTVAQVNTDLLGTARPQGAAYDIGAYERVSVAATPPGAPTIGAATRGNGQATISFTPPASNGGATITSYTVTCTPGAGNSVTASGAASPIVVTGLTNGTSYNCSATATNSAGTGPASATVSVTPATVPGTPTISSAIASNGGATINIAAPASNGGSAIIGYTVICSAPGQATQTLIGTASPALVSNLVNGVAYSCTAAAINNVGTGSASSAIGVTPVGPPGAPIFVSAAVAPGQITVGFSPPSNNGGSPITSYTASCGAQSVSGSSSPLVVVGIAAGATVTCTVTATNAQGISASSAPSNSVTLPNIPAAPVFTSGVAGNGRIVAVFLPSTSDGGAPITGYNVQCASNPLPTRTGNGNGSPIAVTGMTNDTLYSCTIVASNAAGNSAPSNALNLTPSAAAPLTLVAVQSRKAHGSAGNFDLAIDTTVAIGGSITVEPRAGGNHSIAFQFNNPITAAGNVTAVDASSTAIGAPSASASGSEVIVSLSAVPDSRRATVTLTDVNGLSNSYAASIGFLVGDVGSSRAVNAQDTSAVKARSGQTASTANFRFDLNASGSINASDVAAVRKRAGLTLP